MGIKKLRKALDARKIGAVELTEEYLKRIDNDTTNSYITVCREEAIKAARKAQEAIDTGNSSLLTGIPISIKDNICTKGIKTTCASRMLENFVPAYDATVVEKIKQHHGVILGKTNMDEFGMGGTSQNSYFGGVKNPVDKSKVPGGSSGGSAASVGGNLCVAALGSDTGGSVRQPSSFCGVVGLKPTYGTISRYGLVAFASSLDTVGIVTASAEDAGLMLEAVCGYDKRDMTSAPEHTFKTENLRSLKGIKIGIPKEFFGSYCSNEVAEIVMKAAHKLSDMGAELVSCSMPSLECAVDAYYAISSAEASSNLGRYDGIRYGYSGTADTYEDYLEKTRKEGFGEEVKKRIILGREVLADGRYSNAVQMRSQIISEYTNIFNMCDIMLTPTSTATAYSINNYPEDMVSQNICTVTANLAGVPGITVPCGKDRGGMPVGMSLTADKFRENLIISAAEDFERCNGYEL